MYKPKNDQAEEIPRQSKALHGSPSTDSDAVIMKSYQSLVKAELKSNTEVLIIATQGQATDPSKKGSITLDRTLDEGQHTLKNIK
ncbi:unnamed protein product [Dracunculus medinensis]|uniref:Uncharacterized protein n=1 Tax=Dracunculus medinensis TaxID=318479 RepID=A0A0N4U8W8_DRAME|nr:unnamed protein product [Dracunculus medinensis]